MDFADTLQHFNVSDIELTAGADRPQYRLARSRRTMDLKSHLHETLNDLDREQVAAELLAWVLARSGRAKEGATSA